MGFKAISSCLHRDAPSGSLKLVVGLGNPGPQYTRSRHNAGFMCVNRLAKDIGAEFSKKEGLARTAHGAVGGCKVVLARPQTYMNLSGRAVVKLMEKYRLAPEDLIVIHDDMDLKPGQLRIRQGGRSAGHKGIESIINEIDGENFIRVRVGVGRPAAEGNGDRREAVVDFVLDNFSPEESRIMADVMPRAAQAVAAIINDGLDAAMNSFNPTPKNTPGG
jgi:PTH1 family peptidyl-tRNA hydrolase